MSALPYMPLYVADYLADAAHLSTLEHGAYLLLIMTYWQRGKPLPADPVKLARIARLPNECWTDVEQALNEFFIIEGDTWRHKRIDAELAKVAEKSEKARNAGKASVAAKKATPVQQTFNERSTDAEQTLNHTDTDTDTKEVRENARAQESPKGDGKKDPDHWSIIQSLLADHEEDVTDWELEFLHSVKWKPTLTKPQRDSLKSIQDKVSSTAGETCLTVKPGDVRHKAWMDYHRASGKKMAFYEQQPYLTVPTEYPLQQEQAA